VKKLHHFLISRGGASAASGAEAIDLFIARAPTSR
jgi:hypothetical protein